MVSSPEKSLRLLLIAFLEPIPVDIVIKEITIPKATDTLPIKIMNRDRFFLLSLKPAIFLEKYIGNLKLMNLSAKIKNLVYLSLIFSGLILVNAQKKLKTGADQPEIYLPLLKNKNVAVVTNQTGIVNIETINATKVERMSIVDFLLKNGINVKYVLAPEHGFRGDADAGEKVKNGIDQKTGLPIVSLYGNNKKPTKEQLSGIDIVLFDIQDVGVRFYTYISTLAYVMEAVAEQNIKIIVLDRPNPHDGYTDGPTLKYHWKSFVGMHPVPVIYGLTIGEYGRMINGEHWLKKGIQANYTLVPMQNYHKKQRYEISDRPSPNLPNDLAINLYPSLCFFEGTQVSVGRGTDLPFQIYGSPYTKDLPYQFTPKSNFGAKDPFLNGKLCYGENLSDNKGNLKKLELKWLLKAYKNYKNANQDFFLSNLFFDKLAGTDELRRQIIYGRTEKEIRASWQKDLENFEKIRQKYIIYED